MIAGSFPETAAGEPRLRSHRANTALILLASHVDVLRLVTRSSLGTGGGTRDKPKNVCVGG